jgi:hypothetical protein
VHDDQNDRVTLVLADSDLRGLMSSPWDPAVLFAGIAALLASGHRDALVITPEPEFLLPPAAYVDSIGEELRKAPWIRTQTMSDLLRAHSPGTRPVMFGRDPLQPSGYIGETIFSAVQSAHALLDDLAAVADPASLPLESARRSLYFAESRWWSRSGVTPKEATAGLRYALQAETLVKGELGKIRLGGTRNATVLGGEGEVRLVADNGADYAVTVELRVTGNGLRFPEGHVLRVRLETGANEIAIPVSGSKSADRLEAQLSAGRTVLDKASISLHFVTLAGILPWAAAAVGVMVVAVLAFLYIRRRKAGTVG